VYYVGQPVIAVVAESRNQAQDAAELAVVEYESCLRSSMRERRSRATPACVGSGRGNIAAEASYGDPQRSKMLCRCGARHASSSCTTSASSPWRWSRAPASGVRRGRTTLYTQNQTPTGARELLGAVFKRKPEAFRVVNGDIGGGFGMKTGLTPEDALVCYARAQARPPGALARRAQRGVSRRAHGARSARLGEPRAGSEGRILALRTVALANIGAVPVGSSAIIPLQLTPKVQTTVYRVPPVHYPRAGGTYPHHGDRRIPRRRPTRGKLPHGAADGKAARAR
jgi:carbon-monoxide dehydrogenase large subunit